MVLLKFTLYYIIDRWKHSNNGEKGKKTIINKEIKVNINQYLVVYNLCPTVIPFSILFYQ